MTSTQYTIRSVPASVDQALRRRAQKTGKSLNEVVVEALALATSTTPSTRSFSDLNWFIGQKTLESSFDESMDWLERSPREL